MVSDAAKATVFEAAAPEKEVSYDPKALEDSYFGGRLKFRTKIVWQNVIGFAIIHLAGFYGIWLCLCQMYNLQFLSTVYSK